MIRIRFAAQIVVVLLCCWGGVSLQTAQAQARFKPTYFELEGFKLSPLPKRFFYAGVSANAYRGDVSNNYKKWTPAIHAGILWNKKKLLNGGISFSAGRIVGDDLTNYLRTDETAPNTYFSTQFLSLSYDFRLSLVKKKNFMLYVRQGFGFLRFEPYDRNGKKLIDQRNTRAPEESYSNFSTFFPTGMGFALLANNGMGIGLDLGWINPNTDYIDNVSQASRRSTNDNVMSWQIRSYFPLKDKPKTRKTTNKTATNAQKSAKTRQPRTKKETPPQEY